jgi:hypothetical protein
MSSFGVGNSTSCRRCLILVGALILAMASGNAMAQDVNALGPAPAQPAPDFVIPDSFAPGDPILFFKDFELGDDVFDDALANLGLGGDVTFTSDPAAFADLLDDQDWGCVIALNQNFPVTATYSAALTAYVSGGGRAIFTDWRLNFSGETALYDAFEVAGTGAQNQQPITTDGNPIWDGVPANVGLTNPGWGIWSMGLAPVAGGVGTGTFPNGDAAVMIGNGGNTAFNGFLSDTFAVTAEGIQIAENQIEEICFDPLAKDLTSGPDRDRNGAIDIVVPVGELTPTAYDFTITWNGDELVWIYDTVPAEWDVTHIEFDGTGLPLDCGESTDFAGVFGMVDIWRGGKPGKKCSSDTSFRWMPSVGGVTRFYWSNGWTAGPAGGPPGTVNSVSAPDGSDNVVLATLAASGAPLFRVTDVEIDQARDALYFTNWISGSPSGDEAIYRTDLSGAGQVLFSSASSSPGGFASGLHRLAVDPANGDVYFARAVSYANPNEISKVDVSGGGYTQLIGATEGWFYSGLALDNAGGNVYFGDGGIVLIPPINGSLNVMTKAGAAAAVLVPNGLGNGMGKTVAFDSGYGAAGTAFYSGWLICDIFLGPGCGGGDIFAYDVASGAVTLIYSDAVTGIPDIEVDPYNQRIYWTDYVRGEIRSANYDGSGLAIEVSGLDSPFGLALEFGDNDLNVQTLARCHDNNKNKKCRPTSCGALYLNYGATAYDKETGEIVAGPTDPLCLAAVEDVNGDGMYTWDGSGDEDGDTLPDFAEACEFGTDPCDPDTDNDGVRDDVDECPLEGPADPLLGEILDPNGCIRQSQCSDGADNDGDGLVDFPDDPQCVDILDDDESPKACVPSTCALGYPQCDPVGPDGCFCFATDPDITIGVCVDDFFCSGAEDCSTDPGICEPLGKTCIYDSCCGPATCGPAMCTGEIQSLPMTRDPAAPTASGM